MVSSSTRKKATAAIRAMKELGIPAHEAAQVLKRLLEDREYHFEFIENTNYLNHHVLETGKSSSHGTGSQKKLVAGESSSFLNPLKKQKLDERPENLPIVKDHAMSEEEPQLVEPLPVISPPAPPPDLQGQTWGEGPSVMNDPTPLNVSQPPEEQDSPKEKENQVESLTIAAFTNETIASSHSGEVKLLLTCSTDRPGLQVPNMEDVFKMVEDGCVKSYKILQPNFSLMNVLKEICQCALDLGSESNGNKGGITKEGEAIGNVHDVGKGKEILRIAIEKDSPVQIFPAPFYYIRNNYSFEKTQVEVSHAPIGEQDCCANCIADCLHSPIPCACARKTGGEFAYSPDGLIKNKFLEESISMKRNPEKLRLFYCKSCPLERAKNKVTPDSCKGHLIRKFVKECGSKCGCSKQCRNRVVQNGITCNLEVFFTGEAKRWGVRTLDRLPRGAFVCEYAGEILTNMDVYARARQTTDNGRHTYPIILDGAWGTKEVLKDEEALCLDVTKFGNVARFVNHRCHDANLIEIPVEVEMPDRHYYRLALFTTKEVEAFEELTWETRSCKRTDVSSLITIILLVLEVDRVDKILQGLLGDILL